MIASVVLACVLAPNQTPPRPLPSLPSLTPTPSARGSTWQLTPQLTRGQELVYRGQFREEAQGSQVQFSRGYRVEVRVFVLESNLQGQELALQTVTRAREGQTPPPGISQGTPSSARLELLRLDPQGKLISDAGVALHAPLEGVPSLEGGMFVPAPRERIGLEQDWQASEANRPPRFWRIAGTEMVNGTSCLKLIGTQQSDDWDRPRADRTAWRRTDTVWLISRLNYASRVERQIELREPARKQATQRSTMRYDLESSPSYPGPLYDNRQQEILQAHSLAQSAAPLLPAPQKYGSQIKLLLNRISSHMENQTATPYREAILQVQRRLEAAQRGETPPQMREIETAPHSLGGEPGQPAPDFVTTHFSTPGTARLRDWLGRPILLVFYHPSSPVAEPLLLFAQKLARDHTDRVVVLLLSVSDDPGPALRQRTALKLDLPLLSGSGLRISFGIETTPKIVLLDASGIVRGSYLGWGRETPAEVGEELKTWLHVPPVSKGASPGTK